MKPIPYLVLFSSASTLICCVLPALFVALGFGSVVAGLIGVFPQITWASENKALVFGIAGLAIFFSGIWEFKRRNDPCPIDPKLAIACKKVKKISLTLWFISAIIFTISALFVFVIPSLIT